MTLERTSPPKPEARPSGDNKYVDFLRNVPGATDLTELPKKKPKCVTCRIPTAPKSAKTTTGLQAEAFKIMPCRSFALGKCNFQARCIYAHGPCELRTPSVNALLLRKIMNPNERCHTDPNKFKIHLCDNWSKYGSCPFVEECMFAHSHEELRTLGANLDVARKLRDLLKVAQGAEVLNAPKNVQNR